MSFTYWFKQVYIIHGNRALNIFGLSSQTYKKIIYEELKKNKKDPNAIWSCLMYGERLNVLRYWKKYPTIEEFSEYLKHSH